MSTLRVGASATAGGVDSYRYVQTVYFTSSGTFTKASYPWLRAIRVKVQAGGGGGGGVGATTAAQWAIASGGAGGNYGEKFITDIAGLSASETITVGAGGAGGAAGANNGTAGGNSVAFGVTCGGGPLGIGNGGSGVPKIRTANGPSATLAGADVGIIGEQGGSAWADAVFVTGSGGGSALTGGLTGGVGVSTTQRGGINAVGYGGGGHGAGNGTSQTAAAGGNGFDGIVIVELYA